MQKLRETLREHALTTGLVGFVAIMVIFYLIPSGGDNMAAQCATEAVMAIISFAFIAFIAGGDAIRPSGRGFGFSLRKGLYMTIITAALAALMIFGQVYQGAGIVPNWLSEVLWAALLCVFVGMFEEAVFRGVVFNALLSKMGDTRKGLLWAAIISSVLFGIVHVITPSTDFASMTPVMWGQCLGKTVETGMMGFLMAALYVKTKNIWPVIALHGFNDFLLIASGSVFGKGMGGTYVNGDASTAVVQLTVYVVFILVYIPMVVSAARIFKKIDLPEEGFFKEHWGTRKDDTDKDETKKDETEKDKTPELS